MILHYFSSTSWEEWEVEGQPMIRLEAEVADLRERLSRANSATAELEAALEEHRNEKSR